MLGAAAEFWDSKPASEWTPGEIARLSTASPWAVKTRATMGGEAPVAGSLRAPRNATWDQIDQINQAAVAAAEKAHRTPGASIAFYGEVIVTWESAEPMRLIRRSEQGPEFREHYVIRVTGLPDAVLKRLNAGEMRKASLGMPRKRRINADLAQIERPEGRVEFAFPSRAMPLSAADRAVRFLMTLGQMTIQARFDLSRMMFRNALAI